MPESCTPQFDWLNVRVHLAAGCPDVPATVDTWPLHKPWPAGPVPGPGAGYDLYRTIVQGPLSQVTVTLRAGWTTLPAATVTAPGCAAQIDVATLRDSQPVYPAGIVTPGTPDYGANLLSAWIVDATCPAPPTTTTTPPSTTVPPSVTTTTTPRPVITCPHGVCDSIPSPPPTTTTSTTTAPPSPRPELPATGANTAWIAGIGITTALLGITICVATWRQATKRTHR